MSGSRLTRRPAALALAAALFAALAAGAAAAPARAAAGSDRLQRNETLTTNQWLASPAGRLVMQDDGNLVLYAAQNTAIWASNTGGNRGAYLALQGDGNAVVISSTGRPLWASGTNNRGVTQFVLQNDGNLVALTNTNAPAWASNTYKQSYAANRLPVNGWGGEQWSCLNQLWIRESNWNELARNASSGAYGIPQALPATKMAVAGGDYRTNPFTQIRWGEDTYIKGRYGSPCSAWSFWQAHHWY